MPGLTSLALDERFPAPADVPQLSGGFVGVDVFFVISGFVITGLLLRERQRTGRTSILNFYARRLRRILPAATLVILVAVIASYPLLGFVSGDAVANDGRWAAVFLSNFHFEEVGTNYFTANLPPSPLQNFWSLSVEEQFYFVYPTLFLLVARLKGRLSQQTKMTIFLVLVIVVSYWFSIAQTASQPTAAYFSPFTRAWELALGALVAVATPWLKNMATLSATLCTWVGLGAIAVAAFVFTALTPYPGSLVAIPVFGAALVIAGGVAAPRLGAERLLGLGPFQWFGKRSYSLYLWHWPILIIAAEHAGKSALPLGDNLLLILLAIVISMVSYRLIENPIRHWRLPSRTTVAAGVTTVLATVLVLSLVITFESTPKAPSGQRAAPNVQAVLREVDAAKSITKVPETLSPGLTQASGDYGGVDENSSCAADEAQSTERLCFLGDLHARRLLIVYGDSHAVMWLPAFVSIANSAHMKLLVLGKPFCPAANVDVESPPGIGAPGSPYVACEDWHRWAVHVINRLSPSILIVSQDSLYSAPGPKGFTTLQWQNGLTSLFGEISDSHTEKIFLGNIPILSQAGPACLSVHLDDAQACSKPTVRSYRHFDQAEYSVSSALGIRYIDPTPWFCSKVCTAIVGSFCVYMDNFHVSATYAAYIHKALAQAIFSSVPTPTHFQLNISARVVAPANGAVVSGRTYLYGSGSLGNTPVTRVEFRLSGQGLTDALACSGLRNSFGWLCSWNTLAVPNGRYVLHSVAYNATGNSVRSKAVSFSVRN
jgi:peptidoglycan/LPS O-acetylase OafA/YrhL